MRIYYLSTPSFFQVDKEVVHLIKDKCQLHYGVVVGKHQGNFSEQELYQYCEENGIPHTIWKLKYRQRDVRLTMMFIRIIKEIKAFKPDIIYIVSFDHPIFSLLAWGLNRQQTIIALHDVVLHSNFNNAVLHNLSRKISALHFNSYQVFSKEQAKLFRNKYDNKNLYTIPLPLSDYGSKMSPPMKAGRIRFLFFGKILSYKGLDFLIAAANELAKRGADFELVIAGHCDNWNDEYQPLIKDAAKNIIADIRYISNDEIASLFLSAHYLVLPYRDATQSGPLMIAYNYGLPVIASRIDAFEEYVKEGISGYLFDRSAVDNLVTTMNNALLASTAGYDKLVSNLNRFVLENFSQEAVINKYMLMFDTVAANKKRSI
ncbi:MAG: glycosyltransferase family 4 protein [Agriterribacter sp.]